MTAKAKDSAPMPPPAPTAPDLRAVKLVLTAGCNLRCSYCYQSDKKNLRIDWEIVRATLDRLLASARSDVELLLDRKSTRLNSSHVAISYAVFCLKKKKK